MLLLCLDGITTLYFDYYDHNEMSSVEIKVQDIFLLILCQIAEESVHNACNRSLPRLLAMVGDHELHSKEYYGDVFRGIHKKPKINNCAGLV